MALVWAQLCALDSDLRVVGAHRPLDRVIGGMDMPADEDTG